MRMLAILRLGVKAKTQCIWPHSASPALHLGSHFVWISGSIGNSMRRLSRQCFDIPNTTPPCSLVSLSWDQERIDFTYAFPRPKCCSWSQAKLFSDLLNLNLKLHRLCADPKPQSRCFLDLLSLRWSSQFCLEALLIRHL